ncbi:hypothetical protein D9611_010492 [Ephemerocybe angulata]|uniref:Malate dehydrogenase n=1 Tax=Ephemerocybe angulata TaxID=980116 RepID=A0A8H5FAQ0_9AGAR|nr:hypothetical protein D9611_010492 [Tulosesus angulatus]
MLAFLLAPSLLSALITCTAAAAVRKPNKNTCKLDGLSIEGLPSTLPVPTLPLSYVAAAIGVQNYTCSAAGNYSSIGAVAELYDISCLGGSKLFTTIQDRLMGLWEDAPNGLTAQKLVSSYTQTKANTVLGYHYFVPNPSGKGGLSPKWDFTSTGSTKRNRNAFVIVEKVGGATAPTGKQDVDWLATKSVSGGLAGLVYRTDTRQGQPPASCVPGQSPNIQVKYASKYWFFGGSVHHK